MLAMHADYLLKDIGCVLFTQTNHVKIVCVIGCQITPTRMHTLSKRLLVFAMIDRERALLLNALTVSFEDEEENDVLSWCLFIVAPVVTSEAVTGQLGVFSVYASDMGHDEVFPHSDP